MLVQDIDCMDAPVVLSRQIKAERDKADAEEAAKRPPRDPESTMGFWLKEMRDRGGMGPGMPVPQAGSMEEMDEPLAEDTSDDLDLSSLLNCLDGTLEVPGRMVIMTSNHPEMLDAALTRKGRIDMHVELGKATSEIVKDMYTAWYKEAWPEGKPDPADRALTPADVGSVLFDHLDRPSQAVKELAGTATAKDKDKPAKKTVVRT